jgi:hypothetical protein
MTRDVNDVTWEGKMPSLYAAEEKLRRIGI